MRPHSSDTVSARLSDLIQDKNPEVRWTAVEALGKIGGFSSGIYVVEALKDSDPRVREAGVIALGRLQSAAVDPGLLVEALSDPSESVRKAAARTLGEIGDPKTIGKDLAQRLRDGNVAIRRAAVQALLLLDAPDAYPALVSAVHDVDAGVRQGAVATLGEIGASRAIPVLLERLLHDDAPAVRSEAAFRLGKIGDTKIAKELERVAATEGDPTVRRWAKWASEQLRLPHGSG